MSETVTALVGATIFDGHRFLGDHALLLRGDRITGLVPSREIGAAAEIVDLGGGIVAPGFVDLQVNGGGGVMFNDAQDVETLQRIAAANATIGTTALLPTLITDTPERTRNAIAATGAAIAAGVPGIAGLHLEGPHLSIARKGAHDPALIRPMQNDDLELLIGAAQRLPALVLTVAPENVTNNQIHALRDAGALVSLGHTDGDFRTCQAAATAGACCVTHLFNAMSQLGNREPGVVGAALDTGSLSAGLIADLVHVHPASIAMALAAKRGPGRIFLVTDGMATAGSDIDHFILNGRRIERRDGRLTLQNGTLAGADLDFATAIRNLVHTVGVPLETALEMATSLPAGLAGLADAGVLKPGATANVVHLDTDLALSGVWQAGQQLRPRLS